MSRKNGSRKQKVSYSKTKSENPNEEIRRLAYRKGNVGQLLLRLHEDSEAIELLTQAHESDVRSFIQWFLDPDPKKSKMMIDFELKEMKGDYRHLLERLYGNTILAYESPYH